jgi:hypothetical protein
VIVVWANLHGGFLYGWILIALYLVGSAVEIFVGGGDRHHWEFRTRYYAIALGAAVLGTLLTPHGIDLYRHMVAFLNQPYLFDNTQEFTSPNFHEGGAKLFLGALMVTLAALGLERSRPTLPRLLVITAGVYLALTAVRNMSLFGLTALPLLALHMDRVWRDLPDIRGIRGRFEATAIRTATFTWAVPAALLMLGLAFAHGRLGSAKLIADRFDATVFPRAAVERAKSARLEGRMFGEFTWNAYVEYAWPEQKIFIDGGTDFFGEELFREYSTIKSLGAGWRDLLKKWDISTLLLLRQSPLAREASRDGRWAPWYCDSLAVVFRHAEAPRPMLPAQADSAERAMTTCGGTVSAPPPRPRRSEP